MKRNSAFVFGMSALALAFALIFAGCDNSSVDVRSKFASAPAITLAPDTERIVVAMSAAADPQPDSYIVYWRLGEYANAAEVLAILPTAMPGCQATRRRVFLIPSPDLQAARYTLWR